MSSRYVKVYLARLGNTTSRAIAFFSTFVFIAWKDIHVYFKVLFQERLNDTLNEWGVEGSYRKREAHNSLPIYLLVHLLFVC